MERIEKAVFLSYRRTNISWALAIYQNLTLKPDFALPYNNRGIARNNKGDLEGANEDFERAKRLQTTSNK